MLYIKPSSRSPCDRWRKSVIDTSDRPTRLDPGHSSAPSDTPGSVDAGVRAGPTFAARRAAPHPVFWVIAGSLLIITTVLVVKPDHPLSGGLAFGQPVASGGARGIFAFTGQLSKGTFGLYMVDVDAMTLWVYEYLPQKGCLRLAAARTWRYDRYLENFNACGLPPDAVESMIEEQRQYRLQSSESQMP